MISTKSLSRSFVLVAAILVGPWAASATLGAHKQAITRHATSIDFYSTQFTPVNEAQAYRTKILAHSPVPVNFTTAPDPTTFFNQVSAQEQAHHVAFGLLGGLHGDLEPLATKGYLQDLTPLLNKLGNRGFPKALIKLTTMGTKRKHFYIPWIQATYIMAANKKALKYLPKHVNLESLTYNQLIQWGKNMKRATGQPEIGLPDGSTGLVNRFVQGYLYPSFTHSTVVQFKSSAAVGMWKTVKQLWSVTNPTSTTYNFMQDPLLSGEVWVAWDHVARLINAVTQEPKQFVLFPAPYGPKGRGYMAVIGGLAIPKKAPRQSADEQVISYLTKPGPQIKTLENLAFFPSTNAKIPKRLPTGIALEARAVKKQASSKSTVPTLLPIGLGAQGAEFNKAYVDTFNRILVNNEPIKSVLKSEASTIQSLLNQSGAPCWAPDRPSKGTCHIK